ncbi:MAG TPA: preprotein translocase subunit SecE [Limnochordales bacterium]
MALSQQKVKRAASSERAGAGGRIRRFAREVRAEVRKVVWPGRREVVQYTLVVLATALIVAILMGAVDLLVTEALALVLGWGR